MTNWLHKLLNPHCSHCREERQEEKVCSSCEILKTELEALRYNNQQLISNLMEFTKPAKAPDTQPLLDFKPIASRHVPFSITQQRLELESRKKAQDLERASEQQILTEKDKKPIDQLEKELGVEDAS